MACEYCRGVCKHDNRCPLANEDTCEYYCFCCKEGIYEGEEYITNDCGLYMHYDCANVNDLMDFFGCKIQRMRGDCS